MRKEALPGWSGVDSTRLDKPGRIEAIPNPYGDDLPCADGAKPKEPEAKPVTARRQAEAVGEDLRAAAVLRESEG